MRRLSLAVVAVLLVGLAACGGLPTSSGVTLVRPVAGAADSAGPEVRVLPPLPAAGAAPDAIVRGFLNAQADSDDDYAIAREYLAPGATWSAAGTVVVYSALSVPTTSLPGSTVTITATVGPTATIGSDGSYAPETGTTAQNYQLRKVGSEWRISGLPQGLTITAADLQRGYVPSTLWWFTPGFDRLVPEIRWLPQSPAGRQTQLVRALLAGPGPALAPVVRSAAPSGVSLDGSVSEQGDAVVVDLSKEAATLTAAQARDLLLQLAQTLEQVPTATHVRLLVDGQPLPAVGDPQTISMSAGTAYDPDTILPSVPPVGVSGGRVVALPGKGRLPARAVAALSARGVTRAVPDPHGTAIAANTAAGVVLATADGAVRTVVADPTASLSWTIDGVLAVSTPSELLLVSPTGATTQLAYPDPLAGRVTDARIARDGVRLLVVAGASAYVLGLSGATFAPVTGISSGLGAVSAVTWQTASTVALLSRPPGQPLQLTMLNVDGSQVASVPLPTGFTANVVLTSGPGSPLLVGFGDDVDQLTAADGWVRLGTASSPAVAG
ncbi:MAG TPA: LpqB family beta-propeller domain-containing protein [Mycobacteriales bacterium]